MAEYSYIVLYIPRGTTSDAARRILTDHAEYGSWELSKLRLFPDGSRKATLRRQIIRQIRSPLGPALSRPDIRKGRNEHGTQYLFPVPRGESAAPNQSDQEAWDQSGPSG